MLGNIEIGTRYLLLFFDDGTSAPGAKCFCLVYHFPAFIARLFAHLIRTVTRHAVGGRRESRSALQLGSELRRGIMTRVAIDVIRQLVVEVLGYLLAAFCVGRGRHRRSVRYITALKMASSALFDFL